MSRRVLPSRSAKNKAKNIFIALSDDDDEDTRNNSKTEKVKKSNKNNVRNKTLKEDDHNDDLIPVIGFKVENDADESGINKRKKNTSYCTSEDEEDKEQEEEESNEDDDEEDSGNDEYSGVVKKQTPRNKKKSKATKSPSPTSGLSDDEEFDYLDVPIKIEPEDEEEYHENHQDQDENISENDVGTIEVPPPPPPPLLQKPKKKRYRKKEQPNISFHILKQERTIGDQNTAVWATSAFTVTAVLPTPKRNNTSRVDSTDTTKKSRIRNNIKHMKINCPICNEEFTRVKLKRHLSQVHPGIEKPFKCDLCTTTWRSYNKLTDHQISHTDITPFKCDLCEKAFKRKYTLQAHVFYKHTTDGRASLSQFKTKRTVEKIQNPSTEISISDGGFRIGPYKFSSETMPPFHCPEPGCEVLEDTVTRIQRHYAAVHYVRDVMCEQCGKNFPNQRELSVHMRCHRDGRPWVCETCGSTYKSKAHLNSHRLRTHDPVGHEAYKAYRRMTCRKLNAKKKMLKELEKESTENEGSSSMPLFI